MTLQSGRRAIRITQEASSIGGSPVHLRDHVRAVRRFWRTVALLTFLGIAAGVLITLRTVPTYETSTTYFVGASLGSSGSALQADEFAQRRINSYVGVVESERMAQVVLEDTGLSLRPKDVARMISASVQPDTVLLNVKVTDTSGPRSLQVAQSIAKNLDATVGELDNRPSKSTVDIRVLTGPTLNPFQVSPRKKLNIAIGLLLGLAAGVAQALLRHQLDTSFHDRDQLASIAGLPTLGQIPFDKSAKSIPVLTHTKGHSRRAEIFRQLRTSLRFVDAAGPVTVLVVTSSIEGEGKTTTATNLAVSFAEAGSRVLLVDADLRKPKLEDFLDLEGSAGLTSVLIDEATVDDVVQEWGEHGLHVLASGPIPPNPSELLGSPSMEKVIRELRSQYEMIILDSPPLLPVTDAAITATEADGVLVVVRHNKTRRDQLLRALGQLDAVGARVLGTVLSMSPISRRDHLPSYYREPTS